MGMSFLLYFIDRYQHTAASYLRGLARLNRITCSACHPGTILPGGRQGIMGWIRNVKISRLPATTTTINYIVESREIEAEVVVDSDSNVKISRLLTPKCENFAFAHPQM
jgi:cytochrome c peroxidase